MLRDTAPAARSTGRTVNKNGNSVPLSKSPGEREQTRGMTLNHTGTGHRRVRPGGIFKIVVSV